MWKHLHFGTCLVLPYRRLSDYLSQWSERLYSKFFTTCLSWCCCRTSPTTSTGETMGLKSANCEDAAHLDVSARGVWGGRFARSFFDIRVFNPCARWNRFSSSLLSCRRLSKARGRKDKAIWAKSAGSGYGTLNYTIFVMSATEGTAPIATYNFLCTVIWHPWLMRRRVYMHTAT